MIKKAPGPEGPAGGMGPQGFPGNPGTQVHPFLLKSVLANETYDTDVLELLVT